MVHHTGKGGDNATFESITRTHTVDRGWPKIGYHLVIEKDGEVKRGREDEEVGCHTVGANAISLGVCLCGNFDKTGVRPAQWRALVDVLAKWCATYDVIPSVRTIVGHRDKQPTKKKKDGTVFENTCPGENLYTQLEKLRADVAKSFWTAVAGDLKLEF